jgi:hypothetical protein
VTYSASKAFLNMFVEGLHDELAGTGVRAQSLCPGLTDTEILDTEEFAEFNPFARVPDWVFMSPESVVDHSLRALARSEPIVIPGAINRAFVGAVHTPLLGRLLRRALAALSRRR